MSILSHSQGKYNIPATQELLIAAFSDTEFTIFCYDHFRRVYGKFVRGTTFDEKVRLLIDYCDRNNLFDKLLLLVEDFKPDKYAEPSPTLQKTYQQRETQDIQEVPANSSDAVESTSQTTTALPPGFQRESLPSFVILFFNLVVLIALTILFRPGIPSGCISPTGVGLGLGLVTLELFHLTWRFLGQTLLDLDVSIGPLKIQIGKLAALFEQLHPRMLPDYLLWTQAFIFFVVAGVLWSPSLSPFIRPEPVPNIQRFLVHYVDGQVEIYVPGGLLQIEKDARVLVEAQTLAQSDVSCAWSSTKGVLLPAGGCATQYSAPVGGNRDTLTVLVQSPCKAYQTFVGLHIEIV